MGVPNIGVACKSFVRKQALTSQNDYVKKVDHNYKHPTINNNT